MKLKFNGCFVVILVIASSSAATVNAQQVLVGQSVPPGSRVPLHQVDHSSWNELLQTYVDDKGQVNYRAWQANDRRELQTYLNTLSQADPNARTTSEAALAFWINAYNAVTVEGILREYPTTSIRNHTPKLVGYNIWKHLLLIVGDQRISLNDIEHEVLRKMGDPRIHFAIVCASHSCPRLLNEAYVADRLEEQLQANTRNFFANPENFQFDPARRVMRLSSIVDWFKSDFGSNQAARLKAIAPYLPSREAYDAAMANSVRVSYLDYDWSLNEQKPVGQARSGRINRQ